VIEGVVKHPGLATDHVLQGHMHGNMIAFMIACKCGKAESIASSVFSVFRLQCAKLRTRGRNCKVVIGFLYMGMTPGDAYARTWDLAVSSRTLKVNIEKLLCSGW
jgi:hypothetical protein